MKNFKKAFPYFVINLACLYLLPLLIRDTGSGIAVLAAYLPVITVACSLSAATKAGFVWAYPIAIALLFLPSIFLFYNSSAWVYALLYGFIALIGCFFGWLVFRFGRTDEHRLRR